MKKIHFLSVLVGGCFILSACSHLPFSWPQKKAEKQPFWRYVGSDKANQAKYSVDLNSKKKQGDLVTFNGKTTYPSTVKAPANLGVPNFNSMVSQWEMDCIMKTYRLIKTDFLDEKGTVVYQQNFNNMKAKYIGAPETAIARQYKLMCSQ